MTARMDAASRRRPVPPTSPPARDGTRLRRISRFPGYERRATGSPGREPAHGPPYRRRSWRHPCGRDRSGRGKSLSFRAPTVRPWHGVAAKGGAWCIRVWAGRRAKRRFRICGSLACAPRAHAAPRDCEQVVAMSEDDNMAAGWYEATRVASPERPRLNFDLDVDVCVIGAGLAGLDRGARGGAARLVGGGTGGRPSGLRGIRAQYRLRAAGLLGRYRKHGRAHRARSHQAALGAVGTRPRLRAAHDRGNRHAGRRSGSRLAARLEDRQRR